MSLLDKLKKNTRIKESSILEQSTLMEVPFQIATLVKSINVALSGDPEGGMEPGLLMLAGPSKHFKTNMALVIASAFLRKFEDGIILFYDSEFGASKKYFESAGIDPNRVFHTPVTDIEQLKHDTMSQLNELKRGDHVLILVDSIGNLASAKETQDAIDGKSVADMTRAKALKSYFRMVTPHLTIKGIPLVAVNHTYKEIGCLEEHTLIKTDKGDVQIKNIQVGDMVYGVTGLKPVTHIFTPDQLPTDGKRFFELTFDDGSTVRCTDNHKFLGDDGEWIAAADMKIGQRFK